MMSPAMRLMTPFIVEQEVKDDDVVIVQFAPKGPDARVAPSTMNPLSGDSLATANPTLFDAPRLDFL